MAKKSEDRCWPGYEPVPGKPEHSQGSCRPKAESKLTPSESEFRASRRKQLDSWKKDHPGTSKAAAQHLHAPAGAAKGTASKKTTAKKAASKKAAAKKAVPEKAKSAEAKTKTASKS